MELIRKESGERASFLFCNVCHKTEVLVGYFLFQYGQAQTGPVVNGHQQILYR